MPTLPEDIVAGEILEAKRQVGRGEPLGIELDAEPVQQVYHVRGETDGDAHVAEGVFEDEVPADDPGDELAEGGVGVGVGGAGDGNHAAEFRVAEAGKAADDGDQNHGECKRGTGTGAAGNRAVMQDEVDDG